MDELFSKKFILHLQNSIMNVAQPYFERMERHVATTTDLSSKEFWSTRELVDRGWTLKQIDELVALGRLARIDAGGSAGFKYPSIQLKQIIDTYGPCTSLTHISRRKQD